MEKNHFIIICILISLLLLLSKDFRTSKSNNTIAEFIVEVHPCSVLHNKLGMNSVPASEVIIKQRLGIIDAIANGFTLFVICSSFAIISIIVLVLSVIMGLITADWKMILNALLIVIAIPVGIIGLFLFWIMAFFQPCTPAYVLFWLIFGFPFSIIGGGGSNFLIYKGVTVLIKK